MDGSIRTVNFSLHYLLHELATSDDAKDAVCLSIFIKETMDMLLKK